MNRKDSNVQVTCVSMTRDVVSSLLGHVREVKIIVKHILIGMMVRIVWEDIVLREVIEVKITMKHILDSIIVRTVRVGQMMIRIIIEVRSLLTLEQPSGA